MEPRFSQILDIERNRCWERPTLMYFCFREHPGQPTPVPMLVRQTSPADIAHPDGSVSVRTHPASAAGREVRAGGTGRLEDVQSEAPAYAARVWFRAAFQFQGNSSCTRVCGSSAMRASTSAGQACGSSRSRLRDSDDPMYSAARCARSSGISAPAELPVRPGTLTMANRFDRNSSSCLLVEERIL